MATGNTRVQAFEPCQRTLAPPPKSRRSSPSLSPPESPKSLLHCWQHQSQAVHTSVPVVIDHKSTVTTTVRKQSSLDTLINRLGVLDISSSDMRGKQSHRTKQAPNHHLVSEKVKRTPPSPRRKPHVSPGLLALLCFTGKPSNSGHYEIIRRKERYACDAQQTRTIAIPSQAGRLRTYHPLIPASLPEATALALQVELSKPIAPADEEGYIYMYWVTQGVTPSKAETADLLLGAMHLPSTRTPRGTTPAGKSVLVKIGRAKNVHRRLSDWKRQCGHDLTLLRYYPYIASASVSTTSILYNQNRPMASDAAAARPASGVRTVPYTHRVERLIHIELAGRRVKQDKCGVCGKEHREWFSIDASRDGVRAVDEVVRRWVGWAEKVGS